MIGKGLALVSQAPIYDTIFPETGIPITELFADSKRG